MRTIIKYSVSVSGRRRQTAPAFRIVETIKVNDVLEVNIFASEGVFGIFAVLLERISVCTKPIVADIEKISSCLAFIIKNKPPLF